MKSRDYSGEGAMAGVSGFVGEFIHSLDGKKRLTIPSEWREMVGVPERLFVLPGIHAKCLFVYSAREMSARIEKLRALSMADVEGGEFSRALGSRSNFLGWDTQGRIRISDSLLSFAGLINQVVLVGSFTRIELWNPDQWKEQGVARSDPARWAEKVRTAGF